jgi:predicted ATPase
MIDAIEIENLRGIRHGRLEGLKPLTILTGPNASGKSTVLDALLIGASPEPEEAVGRTVERRPAVSSGAKWLIGSASQTARLTIESASERSQRQLDWSEHCSDNLRERLRKRDARPPFSMVVLGRSLDPDGNVVPDRSVGFGADNQYETATSRQFSLEVLVVRLVDPGLPVPLHQTFTHTARTGRREDVYVLLSNLVPDFERLEILVEDDDSPSLYLTSAGRSVPVGLAGDGVQAFIQLALEVAVAPEGLVLVEEPEVYQHPKAIWQTAKVLLANMRRGVQMVITTHSLELIDAILAEASEDDLENIALFNLKLENGELGHGRRAGKEIAFARQTLENDLR